MKSGIIPSWLLWFLSRGRSGLTPEIRLSQPQWFYNVYFSFMSKWFCFDQTLWLEGFPPRSRKDAVDEVKQCGNKRKHLREREDKKSVKHLHIKQWTFISYNSVYEWLLFLKVNCKWALDDVNIKMGKISMKKKLYNINRSQQSVCILCLPQLQCRFDST